MDGPMKIPIFEEILIKSHSAEELQLLISESKIGKVPCFLNLSNTKSEELESIVLEIEQTMLDYGLHPKFPYPFYIIATKKVGSIIPIVRSVKDLPEHYFKKVKRPNNKELQLLNKLSLKVDKISNLKLYKIAGELKDSADAQRRLYNETKELHFLEMLYHRLLNFNPKGKNK